MKVIVFAIPIFFILIGVEFIVGKLKKTELYRFNDAVTNISCGITQQVSGAILKTMIFVGYLFLFENFRLFEIPASWWSYALLFVGIDFFYYWFHRYAHEVSAFWGTHIVHHQSEEYNLSVALRQSTFQTIISNIFYLPLALIGFNPIAFLTINAFQTLYQFWIHTKMIGKMNPIFEYVFNTPSHHRVHHGINPKYIDKNHGGTFIIFDRMFGTFQPEEETVVYGVTRPLASWNPVWANFDYYAELFQEMKKVNLADKFRMLINKPGWRPEYLGGSLFPQPITPEEQIKYDTQIPNGLNYYILFQYLLLLGGATLFLLASKDFELGLKGLGIGMIVLSVLNLGGILEQKRWTLILETLRWLLLPLVIYYFLQSNEYANLVIFAVVGLGLLSIFWLFSYRKSFNLEQSI